MQFAPIVPISCTGLLEGRQYHMVLPQLLDDPIYRDWAINAQGIKILDNGEAEGVWTPPGELMHRAEMIGATDVVVPDVLSSCGATITRATSFRRTAKAHPEYNYIGVLQGKSDEELATCFAYMAGEEWITGLALPRVWANTFDVNKRVEFLERMKTIDHFFDFVHCLGGHHYMPEPMRLCQFPIVRGIDTSTPAILGLEKQPVKNGHYMGRQVDFFERKPGEDRKHYILQNIAVYDEWCAGL